MSYLSTPVRVSVRWSIGVTPAHAFTADRRSCIRFQSPCDVGEITSGVCSVDDSMIVRKGETQCGYNCHRVVADVVVERLDAIDHRAGPENG